MEQAQQHTLPDHQLHHRPPSPPESDYESSDLEPADLEASFDADEPIPDEVMVAGYEFCSREAIRYLLEEEKLDAEHPVVRQLQMHLERSKSHVVGAEPSNPGPSSLPHDAALP